MTLYAIFDPKAGNRALPAIVPEKFSWLAALLPPVFFLVHGLWLALLGFVAALVALGFAARFIGGDVAFGLYVLGAVWLGLAAPALRRHRLSRHGWRHRGDRVASGADLARLEAMR